MRMCQGTCGEGNNSSDDENQHRYGSGRYSRAQACPPAPSHQPSETTQTPILQVLLPRPACDVKPPCLPAHVPGAYWPGPPTTSL